MPGIIACMNDDCDIPGQTGTLVGPPGWIIKLQPSRVLAKGRPVATLSDVLSAHGNFYDPEAPGFNPICEESYLAYSPACPQAATVRINFLPVAVIGTVCTCGHIIAGPGVPTVVIGGTAASSGGKP